MDKKGKKCRICDVFHIHCAKPAPQSHPSPLNFGKFRPFFVLPLSFFHKTIDGYGPTGVYYTHLVNRSSRHADEEETCIKSLMKKPWISF